MKEIIDQAIPQGSMKLLAEMAMLMLLLPVVSGVLGVWQNHLNTKVTQGVIRDLGLTLFQNLQRQSMAFYTDARSGEIVQRITGMCRLFKGCYLACGVFHHAACYCCDNDWHLICS